MSDEQIIELIKTDVCSGAEYSVEQTSLIDNAFKKGTLTWKNIHEMFLRGKNGVYGYYGPFFLPPLEILVEIHEHAHPHQTTQRGEGKVQHRRLLIYFVRTVQAHAPAAGEKPVLLAGSTQHTDVAGPAIAVRRVYARLQDDVAVLVFLVQDVGCLVPSVVPIDLPELGVKPIFLDDFPLLATSLMVGPCGNVCELRM